MKTTILLLALTSTTAAMANSEIRLNAGDSKLITRQQVPASGLRVSCDGQIPGAQKVFIGQVLVNEWTSQGYGSSMTPCDAKLAEQKRIEALNLALINCQSEGYSCDPDLVSYQLIPSPAFTKSFPISDLARAVYFAGCDLKATVMGTLQ